MIRIDNKLFRDGIEENILRLYVAWLDRDQTPFLPIINLLWVDSPFNVRPANVTHLQIYDVCIAPGGRALWIISRVGRHRVFWNPMARVFEIGDPGYIVNNDYVLEEKAIFYPRESPDHPPPSIWFKDPGR